MTTSSAPPLALPVVDEALASRLSERLLEVVEEMLAGHTPRADRVRRRTPPVT